MGYSRYWQGMRIPGQPVPGPENYAQTVQIQSTTYPGSIMSSDEMVGRGGGLFLGLFIVGLTLFYLNSKGVS
jgi:hypothetical protein